MKTFIKWKRTIYVGILNISLTDDNNTYPIKKSKGKSLQITMVFGFEI